MKHLAKVLLLSIILLFISINPIWAATIIASATGGNWSSTAAWVGAVVPGSGDDVILAASSGNITVDGTSGSPSLCQSLTEQTGYTGTFSTGTSKFISIGSASGGSMTLVSTGTVGTSGTITFVSTTTGNTITTAGHAMPSGITFNGAGGGWQFQDNFSISGTTGGITLLAGAFDTGSHTIVAGFSTSGTTTRSLTMGSSSWTTNASSGWSVTGTTGFTFTPGTSSISVGTAGVAGGGLTYYNLTENPSNVVASITGANTFNNLTLVSASSGTIQLPNGATVNGTLTTTGAAGARVFITSGTFGTPSTIVAAAVTTSYTDFQDIIGSGAASWNISGSTGEAGDCGGNSGITFSSPSTAYLVTNTTATGWQTAPWKTTTGGSTAANVPTCQDTAVLDSNSFSATGRTFTINQPRIGTLTISGVTNSPTIASSTNVVDIMGSLTFSSGMTHTGTGTWNWQNRSGTTVNVTEAGNAWAIPITVSGGGTVQQLDNFSSSAAFNISSGEWVATGFSTTGTTLQTSGSSAEFLAGTAMPFTSLSSTAGITNMNSNNITSGLSTVGMSGTATIINGGNLTCSSTFTYSSSGTSTVGNVSFVGTSTWSAGILNTGSISGTVALTLSGTSVNASGNITLGTVTPSAEAISAGTINLNGHTLTGQTTITVSGTGAITGAGTVVGTTFSQTSSGSSNIGTLTLSSTFSVTGGSLVIDNGATYTSSWTIGPSSTFSTNGTPTWTTGTLTVASGGIGAIFSRIRTGF